MVAYRLKKKIEYGEEVADKRKEFSGRLKSKELTKNEEIQCLKHKIQYQEQQVDFLKKISFVEKKAKWASSKKNMK